MWGGWFECVGAYMCAHGVGVIVWQMVAHGWYVAPGVWCYVLMGDVVGKRKLK